MTVGSVEFSNFMSYCLKKMPNERPTAAKLLKHPFITKYAEIETTE
jgi:serine/threonine protein kinase